MDKEPERGRSSGLINAFGLALAGLAVIAGLAGRDPGQINPDAQTRALLTCRDDFANVAGSHGLPVHHVEIGYDAGDNRCTATYPDRVYRWSLGTQTLETTRN